MAVKQKFAESTTYVLYLREWEHVFEVWFKNGFFDPIPVYENEDIRLIVDYMLTNCDDITEFFHLSKQIGEFY